jgi:hypothetical protein
MYQDYKDLLSAFQFHGVKYLVVGGFAVIHHSQPRFTKDMDLFIKPDAENANATYAALAAFGVPLQGASQRASISFLPSLESILTPHGNGEFKPWSIRVPASRRISYPQRTSSRLSWHPDELAILPTLRTSAKR